MGKRAKCECGHDRLGLRVERGIMSWRAVGSIHRLRAPAAWAIQRSVLAFHADAGDVERVEVIDIETGASWSAALSEFFSHGLAVERGAGAQIALPLASWHMAGAGADTSSGSASVFSKHVGDTGAQLQLFDVTRRPE